MIVFETEQFYAPDRMCVRVLSNGVYFHLPLKVRLSLPPE